MKTESETGETLNDFFSNIIKNLNISRFSELDSVAENITESTLRAILRYKDHPSILTIQSQCEAWNISFYWGWRWRHQKGNTQIK